MRLNVNKHHDTGEQRMNIGKHKGVRAKLGNDNGYFFQTMKWMNSICSSSTIVNVATMVTSIFSGFLTNGMNS